MFKEVTPPRPVVETETGWWRLMTVTLFFFVLSYLSTILGWAPAGPSTLRIAGPMLLGVLLLTRPARFWVAAYFLSCFLAWVVSSTLAGRAFDLSWRFGVSRICEIGIAYTLLRQLRLSAPLTISAYVKVLLVTIGAAPLAGATITVILGGLSRPFILAGMADWWIGNAIGMVIVLPAMLSWHHSHWRLSRLGTPYEAIVYLALAVGVSWFAISYSSNPFVLIAMLLVATAFRLTLLGSALSALLVLTTLVCAHRYSSVAPKGLAALDFDDSMFYFVCSVLPALLISIEETTRAELLDSLLRRSKQLRLLLDNVPALIGYIDRRGHYTYVNQKYTQWLGEPLADILGEPHDSVYDDDENRQRSMLHFQCALRGNNQFFEVVVESRQLQVSYIPDLQDSHIEGIFVLASDVSELKKMQRMLDTERERALVTISSIGDAVVTCDTDMLITSLNPVAENLTGWTESEALGKPFSEVIRLLDIETGAPALSPMKIAIHENRIVGLQENCELARRDGMRSAVEDSAAPIRDRLNNVLGGVMVFHDVSESRAMALKMSHMAQHDLLTDLPNRVLLQDRLSQTLMTAPRLASGALLFLDIDYFKRINDTLGHDAGDEVLQIVGRRLLATVGATDTVSRQGGDEFVLLLTQLSSAHEASRVADRVLSAISEPIALHGHALRISTSIGIALFPQDGIDTKTLFKQADTALYHAKRSGRGRFNYFTAAMSDSAEQRMRVEQSLFTALEQGDFFLVFQPKVLGLTGQIVGVEALVRWRDRDTGEIVPPTVFIPIAEECGLITKLDHWVMDEACRLNHAWQEQGLLKIPISVNVSLAAFDTERIFEQVCDTLSHTGLDARWLDIEFTESKMFQDPLSAKHLIDRLKHRGVRVTMDDFGTGYSSLSYAANYEFDALKIDQSFVGGLPDNSKDLAIVMAILRMADALNYGVIAEGVETYEQAQALRLLGCEVMQGYFYSKPLSAEEFQAVLKTGSLDKRLCLTQ